MSSIGKITKQLEEPNKLDFIEWDLLVPFLLMVVALIGVVLMLNECWMRSPAMENGKTQSVYRPGNKNE